MKLKDLFFILIALYTIPQVACQKEPANNTPVPAPILDTTYSRDLGWISCDYNGVFQQQRQTAYYSTLYDVSGFELEYPDSALPLLEERIWCNNLLFNDSLQLLVKPCTPGRTPLSGGVMALDGDQVLQTWNSDTMHNNYVQYTSIDTVLQRVKGVFQVRLISDGNSPPPFGRPDTIELTNGKFYLEYEVK